ncbi:hypothetical protein [Corynebacterium silvaticum]|uniref:Uncharacterized protein n=1 Tax=Corynebacterium silvaticum TaxID=2320431 RepID=A0ACD4Q0Y7_9CORY|nr:hypothetical protein [Corynebacterium silvaticum]WCV10783.1 hypothetical protein CBE74_12460 [Corynebacterium silvaticum]
MASLILWSTSHLIDSFNPSTGKKTVVTKDTGATEPSVTALDQLPNRTFNKKDSRTIESIVNKGGFGELGSQITYEYSYTAANTPGTFVTSFQMKDPSTKEFMEK